MDFNIVVMLLLKILFLQLYMHYTYNVALTNHKV